VTLTKPAASTHPYPAVPAVAAVAAVVEGGLSVEAEAEAEAEEDISPGLEGVCPSACPADRSYVEEVGEIQAGSYLAAELDKLAAAVVAGFELVEVGKLLQRLS
jgi:hypothetical protein